MPYFKAMGGEPTALIVGVLSMVLLVIISLIMTNTKIKEKKIRIILIIMILIQLGVAFVDNYIRVFPLLEFDPRAFEGLAWFSYENNVNVGRGAYNYYILNPIYKIIRVRSAMIFEVLNILFSLLINLNLYEILKKLKIEKNLLILMIGVSALSPISLIYRTGILREATIILFISYSLKNFIFYCIDKDNIAMIKSFVFIGIGAIFHSGAIFIAGGYMIALSGGKKNQKIYQLLILILGILGFILFKDSLLEKVGGGDIDAIVRANNYTSLKMSSSGYLQSITTESLTQIVMYLPLFIFYFLFSPTPDMFRGVIDIISFLLNSSIYIYLILGSLYYLRNLKRNLKPVEKKILKCLFLSAIFTIAVFSIGTRNAGTALRHRDKIVPLLIVIFSIIKNRYIITKERRDG